MFFTKAEPYKLATLTFIWIFLNYVMNYDFVLHYLEDTIPEKTSTKARELIP